MARWLAHPLEHDLTPDCFLKAAIADAQALGLEEPAVGNR